MNKRANLQSRSKPVASLFVGGLQSNSKCALLLRTTRIFQACSTESVDCASMWVWVDSWVSPTMHCALRRVLRGAQTARLLCFSPSVEWGTSFRKDVPLFVHWGRLFSVHWGSSFGRSCQHARFLAVLLDFGVTVCACCTQAHVFPF